MKTPAHERTHWLLILQISFVFATAVQVQSADASTTPPVVATMPNVPIGSVANTEENASPITLDGVADATRTVDGVAVTSRADVGGPSCEVLAHRIAFQNASYQEVRLLLQRGARGSIRGREIADLAGVLSRYQSEMPERVEKSVHIHARWSLEEPARGGGDALAVPVSPSPTVEKCFQNQGAELMLKGPGIAWSTETYQLPDGLQLQWNSDSITVEYDVDLLDACFSNHSLEIFEKFRQGAEGFASCDLKASYSID